jgi:signal transduction histidine kinase
MGRREALRAALVNLALNAIDATGAGGHVSIAAEVGGGRITLAVEDDGPGPPTELGTALAEPFVTGKQEGVGLGLSVARAVAEQHGGTLAWRRADGRTRFTIALPEAAIAATSSHQEPVA